MKKQLSLSLLIILLGSAALVVPAIAGGKGWIRIEPHAFDPPDPVILESPATFYVNLTSANKEVVDPQLLLITSKACLDGLSGPITVSWNWEPYVPPVGVSPFTEVDPKAGGADKWIPLEADGYGKIYEADSLASHLESGEDTIWYAYVDMPVDGNKIEGTDLYEFVLTVPSSAPRVLVYVFGEDAKVPPTRPGFVIPEIAFGSIAVLALMMAALFLRGRVQIIPQ